MGEVDRLIAEVATIALQTLREVAAVSRAAHRASARRPGDGWLARLAGQLDQAVTLTERLLWQTQQRLAGNRSIPDHVVSPAPPLPRLRPARPVRLRRRLRESRSALTGPAIGTTLALLSTPGGRASAQPARGAEGATLPGTSQAQMTARARQLWKAGGLRMGGRLTEGANQHPDGRW